MLTTDDLNLRQLRGHALLTPVEVKSILRGHLRLPEHAHPDLTCLKRLGDPQEWMALASTMADGSVHTMETHGPWSPQMWPAIARHQALKNLISEDAQTALRLHTSGESGQTIYAALRGVPLLRELGLPLPLNHPCSPIPLVCCQTLRAGESMLSLASVGPATRQLLRVVLHTLPGSWLYVSALADVQRHPTLEANLESWSHSIGTATQVEHPRTVQLGAHLLADILALPGQPSPREWTGTPALSGWQPELEGLVWQVKLPRRTIREPGHRPYATALLNLAVLLLIPDLTPTVMAAPVGEAIRKVAINGRQALVRITQALATHPHPLQGRIQHLLSIMQAQRSDAEES